MTIKTDRRILQTKAALKASLIELMREEHILKISVKNLCKHAQINRGTFYAHYKTPFDILSDIQKELFAQLAVQLDNTQGQYSPEEQLVNLFRYIAQQKEVCTVLLGKNGDEGLAKDIMAFAVAQCRARWIHAIHPEYLDRAEAMFGYIAHGSVGLIRTWLEGGYPQTTNELASIIRIMTANGISRFLS